MLGRGSRFRPSVAALLAVAILLIGLSVFIERCIYGGSGHATTKALTIQFSGYTNQPGKGVNAVFEINNRSDGALVIWSYVDLHYRGDLDTYEVRKAWPEYFLLNPGENRHLAIVAPTNNCEWRMEVSLTSVKESQRENRLMRYLSKWEWLRKRVAPWITQQVRYPTSQWIPPYESREVDK